MHKLKCSEISQMWKKVFGGRHDRSGFSGDEPRAPLGFKVRIHLSGWRDLTSGLACETGFSQWVGPNSEYKVFSPSPPGTAGTGRSSPWPICKDSQQDTSLEQLSPSQGDAPERAPRPGPRSCLCHSVSVGPCPGIYTLASGLYSVIGVLTPTGRMVTKTAGV